MPRKISTPVAESTMPSRVPASMVVRAGTSAAVDCAAMRTVPLNVTSSVTPTRSSRAAFDMQFIPNRHDYPVKTSVDWVGADFQLFGITRRSLLRTRLCGLVDPFLNRGCVKAIVVVMAAAVPAAVAHVGDESHIGAVGSLRQEN